MKHLHRHVHDVRWGDMDAFSHVNNARYLDYLQEARIAWLDGLGEAWVTEQSGPVVASIQIDYRKPIEYPARVVVDTWCERLGNRSMTLLHRLTLDNDPTTEVAQARVVMVWVDRRSGSAIALPAHLVAASQ
jgi:acyl-CoA thioester hydrolase